MKPFRFRLSTLLKLREMTRDELRGQLAEAFRAEEILGQQLAQLDQQVADARGLQTAKPGQINVDRMIDAQRYGLVVEMERQAVLARKERLGEEIVRRRDALAAADRELKTVEKLRETQAEAYLATSERLEHKIVDEAAQQVWAREAAE